MHVLLAEATPWRPEEERHTGWEAERMQRTQQASVIRCVVETGLGLCGASACVDNWGAFLSVLVSRFLRTRCRSAARSASGWRAESGKTARRAADAGRAETAVDRRRVFLVMCVCVTL